MSRARKVTIVAGTALALFLAGGLGGFRPEEAGVRPVPARAQAALAARPVVGGASLSGMIAALQARLRVARSDWRSYASLGLAYVQQARITADPTYYPKAEGALRRSLELSAEANYGALAGMGALALARHDFAGALAWGRRAEAVNPYNGTVHGVIGDALVELGRYGEAFDEIQRMVDLHPDLSSYARVSYARELRGDTGGAVRAMELAMQAAGTAEDLAWTLNQLGELAFNHGDMDEAETRYRRALAADPAFVPPRAGLAKVLAARGARDRAIAVLERVIRRYPAPEYVITLVDLYTASGQPRLAERYGGLLRAEEALFRANGVNVDLEVALFDADHGIDPSGGLAAARAEWERRRSVHVADALAWTLYANGRPGEALGYANRALSLGTRSASFHFHRGMIERALNRTAAARRDLASALAINPHFSILWADRAASILRILGGRP